MHHRALGGYRPHRIHTTPLAYSEAAVASRSPAIAGVSMSGFASDHGWKYSDIAI